MGELTTAAGIDSSALLSRAEIGSAINSLNAAEQTALMKIAKHYAKVRIRFDPKNLVHGAICQVLDGRRVWPKDVPATVLLGAVIRSIAWKLKSTSDLQNEEKIDVMKIIALFGDDPVAQKIVMAMMDGARGEELQQLSGLNSTEYESKRKKNSPAH